MLLRPAMRTLMFLAVFSIFFSIPSQANPPTKEQIFQVASLAARDGEYDKAIDFFRKVLEIDPRFAPAYSSLGMVYQARGGDDGPAQALRYYKLAVDIDPRLVETWNNLGRLYYSTGQFVNAEKAFLKSLELRPTQTDIELVIGWVYLLGESRAEDAIKHFQAGLAGGDDDMAHYGIGLSDILLGDRFKVLDEITELRRRHKEDLAAKLENMVRGRVKIDSHPGSPLVTGVDQGESVFNKELQGLAASGFNNGADKKGIQVRLKGPLAN
ncbi:MAG: tetratricopeptide repeat protein [Candidatus Omnitrophica bacterium]|nr:tetratricopeptide repeat protein [Candidatus Omnitrophota bacterium]